MTARAPASRAAAGTGRAALEAIALALLTAVSLVVLDRAGFSVWRLWLAASGLIALYLVMRAGLPPGTLAAQLRTDAGLALLAGALAAATRAAAWAAGSIPPGAVEIAVVVAVVLGSLAVRWLRRWTQLHARVSALAAPEDAATETGEADPAGRLAARLARLAADLERTRQELAAERSRSTALVASRRELIGTVSRELGGPVATLQGHLETTIRRWRPLPAPSFEADLAVIEEEVTRLRGLLDDLLVVAQADTDRPAPVLPPVDCRELVERVAARHAPAVAAFDRVELVTAVPGDLPFGLGDAPLLERALVSLLLHAVRQTPPGGLVALGAGSEGGRVWIEVATTGLGAAPRPWHARFSDWCLAAGAAWTTAAEPGGGTRWRLELRRL